ncbi:MAG TPA: pseudouridine-5'-phosphate glycosidase [Candidatus Limnocylindrales bacterium]|nr:pseudouridine-5'-phosphate glycosidase [Candidatus Limnocylindrales bacterium]
MITDRLSIAPAVAAALRDGEPVVALESTLISHGLPFPQNLEVACAAEAAVAAGGATPATIAIRGGRIHVGLDRRGLETLANAPQGSVVKAARPNLAAALSVEGWAATTVSASMIAAAAAGIRVFATGGIGGVHRGASRTLDISSDLDELARTRVVVVCAGPKSILDVPATLEYLETRGVPVVTIGQDEVPGFYSRGSGIRTPWRVDDAAEAARLAGDHLELGLGSGMLICVPVPEDAALSPGEAGAAVARAIEDADAAGVGGPDLTPWLLGRIAELTNGAAVRANTALIVNNARVAAEIAGQLVR